MSFKDVLKKNLTPELQTQVFDALGDDFDFDMVPRSRLNKVITQRNELRSQLAQSNGQNDDDDDDDDDNTGKGTHFDPKKFVSKKDHDKELQDLKDAHTAEIENMRKQNVALDKLRAKGAVDPDTILKSGLLDMTKMSFGEDGKLSGIDDAIENLVKEKAYFFSSQDNHQQGTGKGGNDKDSDKNALDAKLNAVFGQFAPLPDTNE